MWKNQPDRYAAGVIAVHWLTVVLLVLTYGAILLHNQAFEGSALRATFKHWHSIFGLLVLPLVAARVLLRILAGPAPSISPPIDPWLRRASQAFHLILVAFLIVVPMLGWLKLSAHGKAIPFGLPALISVDLDLAKQLKNIHVWIGEAGYYLIGIHAIATLAHHYILDDDTLRRMLPKGWFGNDRLGD